MAILILYPGDRYT